MVKLKPKLVEVTPEGKIVAALVEGLKSYSELKSATGLSDRWLSRKLKELLSSGIIRHSEGRYQLEGLKIVNADPLFACFLKNTASLNVKARLIAGELSRNDKVVSIVLFGSVARGEVGEKSDIDLLVVTEVEFEDRLNSLIHELMLKYNVPVEAVFLTYEDLLANLQAKTAFSFGLLESYQVLYDRGGVETLLSIKRKEIRTFTTMTSDLLDLKKWLKEEGIT
ncbi:TPA: hypothetical protein EYP27_07090, partial [Candidatus Bathyarchaeota archaeon]|nr:hypothetical protein [Candidatus Bathyarchaeota archaeon]